MQDTSQFLQIWPALRIYCLFLKFSLCHSIQEMVEKRGTISKSHMDFPGLKARSRQKQKLHDNYISMIMYVYCAHLQLHSQTHELKSD